MEIEGIIVKDLGVREGQTERGAWRIASYLIETVESFPKRIAFDVMDGETGRIARLGLTEGKRVRLFFDITAREGKDGRWFNQVRAYDARPME